MRLLRLHLFLALSIFTVVTHAETLKVGLSDADYPPYYYVGKQGLEGAAVEIGEYLAKSLGYQLEYQRYPWKRVQHNLKLGVVDMVLLYFKTAERGKDVIYTDSPHLIEKAVLFGPDHLDIEFSGDLSSISQYEFYGIRGYYYGEQYKNASYLSKHEVRDEPELIRWIASDKRSFLGIGNPAAIEFYANKIGISDKIRFYQPALYEGENYFAFSRARTDAQQIADRFTQAFISFKQTSKYKEILQRYQISP